MNHTFKLLTLAPLLASIVSCDFMRMDYVPTSDQIVASHGTFLVAPKSHSILGHYANMDVDSTVFTYTSEAVSDDVFWQSIDSASSADGWKCIGKDEMQRRFERIIPKTGQKVFHSAEQVRVHFDPSDNTAVVAWVQGDSSDAVDHFDSTGEAAFADRAVWPRFDSLAKKSEP